MCGIVGLYYKNLELESSLGSMLSDMLIQMTDRGPDSAGVALYHNPVKQGGIKLVLQAEDDVDWPAVTGQIQAGPGRQRIRIAARESCGGDYSRRRR